MRKTKEQKQKLAQALMDGRPVSRALVESGYTTERQAKKCKVPKDVIDMMPPKAQQLMAMGKQLTPDNQKYLVRGRLAQNTIQGKDGGTQAAKLLGSERGIDMFVPDNQTGVITLVMPKEVRESMDDMLKELEAAENPTVANW
jgi:hypothetical protein